MFYMYRCKYVTNDWTCNMAIGNFDTTIQGLYDNEQIIRDINSSINLKKNKFYRHYKSAKIVYKVCLQYTLYCYLLKASYLFNQTNLPRYHCGLTYLFGSATSDKNKPCPWEVQSLTSFDIPILATSIRWNFYYGINAP